MSLTYSLSEAARVTDKSRVTLRRWLDDGRFINAYRETPSDPSSPWKIPAADLESAGATFLSDTADEAGDTSPTNAMAVRLAVAEAIAAERGRRLDDAADFARALSAQAEAVTALLARVTQET